MAYVAPQVYDFKTFFARDFPYGVDPDNDVLDADILKTFVMVQMNINEGLFPSQGSYTQGYLLMAAHYLVTNLRASSQGLNGQWDFLHWSKGVGAVNQAFAIPQRILDNPYWSMLAKTNYGSQFLFLILPQLCGQVGVVYGSTRP